MHDFEALGRRFDKVFAVNINVFWTSRATEELAHVSDALAPRGTLFLFYETPTAERAPGGRAGRGSAAHERLHGARGPHTGPEPDLLRDVAKLSWQWHSSRLPSMTAGPVTAPRTGPIGRAVRLLLAAGFAYGLATLVDQGGPASVRDPETLTDAPFVILTVAMVALYAVLVSELAKLVVGEAFAKTARKAALGVLGAAVVAAALVGAVRSEDVWGSPLSDLVWGLDVTMLTQTIVALLIAVVLGTPGCEIGVWGEIAARFRGRPASPPLCIIGLHHLDNWELRRRSAREEAA